MKVLETFESLPESDQQAVVIEILRRTADRNYATIEESDLVFAADQVFLELDRREGSE
ncbi:MAG TPA: hypothetical protein VIW92_08690 [Thermoanaerobaculia bacterium]